MSNDRKGLHDPNRKANIGINVLLQVVLGAVVLVMVNYLAMRHYHRFDWTKDNIYTLSEQTKSVLHSLPRQVDLVVMMSQGDVIYGDTREMLERYVGEAGSRLNVRYVDPDQDPTEFEHILEQYPVQAGVTQNQEIIVEQVIVVAAGENNRFVTPNEDFVSSGGNDFMEMGGGGATFNPPQAETALTSAIYRVVADRRRVICLTSGHGEWQVEGGGDRSLGDLGDHLERFEVEFRNISVAMGRQPDFDACDAVVVAGPRRPFMPEEARALEHYVVEEGGDLVLALDPIVERGRFVPTGLEGLARRLGVDVQASEVVDARATAPFCGGGHPTAFVALSREQPVCISRAQPVTVVEGREGQPFLETISEEAFAELNAGQLSQPQRDGDDPAGPFTLGVAVVQENQDARNARLERRREEIEAEVPEEEQRGSLVVVVGDADFLAREHRQNPRLGNFGLAVGLLNSVADNTVLVAQPPRDVEHTRLTLTDAQLSTAWLVFIFILPLFGIVGGVSMWWTRRR